MGVGQIPVSEIEAYARAMGYGTPDEFETLLGRVQSADGALLAWLRRNPSRTNDQADDKTDEDAERFGLYINR